MLPSSPAAARLQRKQKRKFQDGTIVSWTVVHHPPAGFGHGARTVGLVQLDDGSQVLAQLLMRSPAIGMRVRPRMSLSAVTPEKLRLYGVAYEQAVPVKSELPVKEFPGYIVALTGPSGVGKTLVCGMIVGMFGEYASRVPLVTTAPRNSAAERGELKHISRKKFEESVASGDMVAMVQTEEKEWFGYRLTDIKAIWSQGKIPLVTTDMHLLRELSRHFGRRSILSFGLLPPGTSKRAMLSYLLRELRTRGRTTEEWMEGKIRSAAQELHSLRAHTELFDRVFVNTDAKTVVEKLRKHVPEFRS